ncbi:MAG: hypothetical protein ABI648_01500 [Betaproteobacteria bacterium]|jgi:hypothetical protein
MVALRQTAREWKPPCAKALNQSFRAGRGDDDAAQHAKAIDENPENAQKWHLVQMAVCVDLDWSSQTYSYAAPTTQNDKSTFHTLPLELHAISG